MRFPMHRARCFAAILCGSLLLTGCDKASQSTTSKTTPAQKGGIAASDVQSKDARLAAVVPSAPGTGEKNCFACNAAGEVPCKARGCAKGMAECPGPCARLTKGVWEHMNVPGHAPGELWQKVRVANGWQSYSQAHVGEVFTVANGAMVNQGKCPVCGGTTRVECKTCKKTGKEPCEVCSGKKFIPVAWTSTDNPWFNRQPDLIRLRDGKVLLGKVAGTSGNEAIIRSRDGKITRVPKQDIMSGETQVK